ncbi:MAG: hypothetical protein H7Y11_10130 [Armatimonadetes bacterium]|nr:hypothetical protein [Anaerolineae bacterium]
MTTQPLTDPMPARSTQETALMTLTALHIIPVLRWEREGDASFETGQARLLDVLSILTAQIRAEGGGALRHLLLGGQSVLLEDIAALQPDLLSYLVVCNATNRVEIGPWYTQVDDTLVSAEALIRNLLMARTDADRYGVRLMQVAYLPDLGGHSAHLPQILRGFGIDAALLQHGAKYAHLPFRWEAPDGSSVLVFSHDARQSVLLSLRDQKALTPDGPFLWMLSAEHDLKLKLPGVTLPTIQSSLTIFTQALRLSLHDDLRPALHGELRLQGQREAAYLLPGTLSARLHLKQANARIQALLTHAAEPWLALALTHTPLEHGDNLLALLGQSWRTLLKNQARPVLGGYASDRVSAEAELRFQRAEDSAQHVIQRALAALPGDLHTPGFASSSTTYVVVWNAHNWLVRQVVTLTLDIAPGQHPTHLSLPNQSEQPFSWQPSLRRLTFIAEAPPVGYTTYTLKLGDAPTPESQVQVATGDNIASARGDTLSAETGELVWRVGSSEIRDLLRLIDSGDAGDAFNYSPPHQDVIERATLVSGLSIESSALYERLTLRHRMRIAAGLRPDRSRERGVRLLELNTTATFYDGMPGIYFQTAFVNSAEDHRLRAHVRTGVRATSVVADSALGLVERPLQPEGALFPSGAKLEGASATYPMQTLSAVSDANATMALLGRGLPEFEAISEDDQTTLALTLVRSVGWLSRDDLRTRTAPIGTPRPAPGAQTLRPMHAEYALLPLPASDPAALLRTGQSYIAPLQAYQYDRPPDKPRRSYLSIQSSLGTGSESDGNGAILTTFKPALQGRGWVLRLFNPTAQKVEALVTPNQKPRYARLTNLAEEAHTIIEPDANGSLHVVLLPHKLVTLRLGF